MFYKINNKNLDEILQDFHFVVLFPPPIIFMNNATFYPWQVWVNDNWVAQNIDEFEMTLCSYNTVNYKTGIINWIFKTKSNKGKDFQEFIIYAEKKYKNGWSFGIVDTYDFQNLDNTSIKNIFKKKYYDYSIYQGVLKKKL